MSFKEIIIKNYATKYINLSIFIAHMNIFRVNPINNHSDYGNRAVEIGEYSLEIKRKPCVADNYKLIVPDHFHYYSVSTLEESIEEALNYAKERFPKELSDVRMMIEPDVIMHDVDEGNIKNILGLSWQFAELMIQGDVQRAWREPILIDDNDLK